MTGPKIREVDYDLEGYRYVCRRKDCNVHVAYTRKRGNPLVITINGVATSIPELAEKLHTNRSTILKRLNMEMCMSQPVQVQRFVASSVPKSLTYEACPVASKFLRMPRPEV